MADPVQPDAAPSVQVAEGGRRLPFHVGEAARAIGGLGEAMILSGRIGALAQRDGMAEAIYMTLCNTVWEDRHGQLWGCTWRCAGDIAAAIRGLPDDDFETFFQMGGEGRVDPQIRAEITRLRWTERTDVPWWAAPAPPRA